MSATRQLAVVLNADVVGYTRLMGDDEVATVAALDTCRETFRQTVDEHSGTLVDTAGDSVLATFGSAINAVKCSVILQQRLSVVNDDAPDHRIMEFRIGLNLGDILVKGDGTVYGDGVNVAARLQALAEPGGICISASVRDLAKHLVGLHTRDLGKQNVKGVEYAVHAHKIVDETEAEAFVDAADETEETAWGPVIAVLPFQNLGSNEEDDYLADGLAEDITTELSKIRSLMIIARNTAFAYRGAQKTAKQIGDELDSDFVVQGSVRRAGSRVRVTAELVETESNTAAWTERFDREMDDMFALQDEIASRITGVLPSRIETAELQRTQGKSPTNLAAYQYLLRAKFHHHRRTFNDNREAQTLIAKAIELDDSYAANHAWQACILWQSVARGYTEGSPDILDAAMNSLDRALQRDNDDFETHRVLSGANLIQRNYERAVFHAARAYDLNPNDPRVMSQYGDALTANGQAEEAIPYLERALQVDPYLPDHRLSYLGTAQFLAGQFSEAVISFKKISDLQAEHHLHLAACHAELGDGKHSALQVAEVRRLFPEFVAREYIHKLAYRLDNDREKYRRAFAKANLIG
ncbi:MAG: adenylate/guanylate cyclase domain-containing protein [Pseudomonadota bacterium]